MMGTKIRSFSPLPRDVSLEELVPADHFYRRLDAALDLGFVRELVAPLYAGGGRPSVDPVVFFKLQLVMFFEDLRSERQLMRAAADRLSVRWYLGYDLFEQLPDHSSLTRIRDRYGLGVFRRFFERIVELCAESGLVWGKELYFDATKVEANASLDSVAPRFFVEAHLSELFEAHPEAAEPGAGSARPLAVSAPDELAAANAERHNWIDEEGRQNREVKDRDYRRVSDLKASRTDPDASLMNRGKGGSHLGYHAHYVVDGGRAHIILQALVTPSEVMENQPMLDLLWRSTFRWKIRPRQVTGDTTYGTLRNITAVEQAGIRAYVPLSDYDGRRPFFGKNDFLYDPERDAYVCPQGQLLRFANHLHTYRAARYQADAATCNACPVKSRCTTSPNGRTLRRSLDEAYFDRARAYHETEPYKKALRKRKVWVEPLFAEGKQWHGMSRFRLRRLRKVNVEALLLAAGQNVKRLLEFGCRGPRKLAPAAALRPPGRLPLLPIHSRSMAQQSVFQRPVRFSYESDGRPEWRSNTRALRRFGRARKPRI